MPRLFIISGCNGSGKTTATYGLLPEMLGCSNFVNSDEFAKSFSPFNPESASISASRYMLMKIRYMFQRRADFCIETTLATRTLVKMVKEAQANGYTVTILYLWLSSPELAVERVKSRVKAGGHYIKEDTIRRRYYLGLHYLFKDFIPLCNKWIVADNSENKFEIVAEGSENGVIIRETEKFNRIQTLSTEYGKSLEREKNNKQ